MAGGRGQLSERSAVVSDSPLREVVWAAELLERKQRVRRWRGERPSERAPGETEAREEAVIAAARALLGTGR